MPWTPPVEPVTHSTSLRRAPVQQRSAERLSRILDACAQLLDEGGYEELSTRAVAVRAGVPIGSVYRFFGNKRALVDALAERNLQRYAERIVGRLAAIPVADWRAAMDAVLDEYLAMKRTAPGFSLVDFGNQIPVGADAAPTTASPTASPSCSPSTSTAPRRNPAAHVPGRRRISRRPGPARVPARPDGRRERHRGDAGAAAGVFGASAGLIRGPPRRRRSPGALKTSSPAPSIAAQPRDLEFCAYCSHVNILLRLMCAP